MLLLGSTFRTLVTLRHTPIWNRVHYHYFERELLDILDLTCTLCIEYILVLVFQIVADSDIESYVVVVKLNRPPEKTSPASLIR